MACMPRLITSADGVGPVKLPLRFLAGPEALAQIRERGLTPDDVALLLGASGGPKWFVLAAIDEYLARDWLAQRRTVLDMLGSSAGAWRLCALAQPDPLAATRRLADCYSRLDYPANASRTTITTISRQLLDALLPDQAAVDGLLANPQCRFHLIAARARGLAGHSAAWAQGLGLAAAALLNVVSRQLLGGCYQRTLFHHPQQQPPVAFAQLATVAVPLARDNLHQALFASGAIPLVLEPVRGIKGAPAGGYVDGGVSDYHFDLQLTRPGLILYPHFYPYLVPGWFDKGLKRRVGAKALQRTLLLCPSADFIARLPYGRIPDRRDFTRLPFAVRLRYWQQVMGESQRLADCFGERCQRQDWHNYLEPL